MSQAEAEVYQENCPSCGSELQLRLGKPSALAKETTDEYRGKSLDQGLNEKLLERSKAHFRQHDLPRLIEKHGREFAIRQGWIDDEGKPK